MKPIYTYLLACLALVVPAVAKGFDLKVWQSGANSRPHNTDISMSMADSEGYRWYSSSIGLIRDDGYRTVIFMPKEGTLRVLHIAEAPDGNLWISAEEGAYIFDKATAGFTPLDPERIGRHQVKMIAFTDDGNAWVGQNGTLHRYDKTGKWIKDYETRNRRNRPAFLTGACQTPNGDFWITSFSRGIFRYDSAKDSFEEYASVDADVSLGSIVPDHKLNRLWVKDHEGNLYCLDIDRGDGARTFVKSSAAMPGIDASRERITDFVQDSEYGYLWCIARSQVLAFEPQPDGSLRWLDLSAYPQLHGHIMTSIHRNKRGLWVTCFDSPSFMLDLGNHITATYKVPTLERYGNEPVVTDVAVDPADGMVWFLQSRSGLALYNPSTGAMADHDRESGLQKYRLYRASEMAFSNVLKGVWTARAKEDIILGVVRNGMVMHIADSLFLPKRQGERHNITAMLEDRQGRLWAASAGSVYSFSTKTKSLTGTAGNTGRVAGIVQAPDNTVWCASDSGLVKLGTGSAAEAPQTRSRAPLAALTADAEGNIWCATQSGSILKYNPKSDKWEDHSRHCGVQGLTVTMMHSDTMGHLWIMAGTVAVEYNPSGNAMRMFPMADEEGISTLLSSAPAVSPTGSLITGGMGGLVAFRPSHDLDTRKCGLTPHLTDLKSEGTSLLYGPGQSATGGGLLRLPAGTHNITVELSALDPRYAGDIRFAYRLKGIDKEWNTTARGENTAAYNLLPPGRHALEVRVCDNNNIWGEPTVLATIEQQPFWYQTWWARLAMVLLLVAIGASAVRMMLARQRKRNEEIWTDSEEMIKMRTYLSSPVTLPDEEFRMLDKMLIEKATKVVEANLADPMFSVNTLAEGVNMSRSSLNRKLKSITGQTPLSFILDIKMSHACRLLESQNYTVNEVAERVGFEDRHYFTNKFRKEMGVTPSAYLKGERGQRDGALAEVRQGVKIVQEEEI